MTPLGLADAAMADSPFLWSTPASINHDGASVYSVSCVSTPFCVAVDGAGNVLTSTNPSTEPPTWTVTHVDGTNRISDVSCVSTSFCVAVDHAGNVLTSTDPTAELPTWTVKNVDVSGPISGVSCVSRSLCLAVDFHGNILTSTNPAEPDPTWTETKVDNNPHLSIEYNAIWGVSCPSVSLCVAVDSAGNVVSSTDPTGGATAWTITSVEANTTIYSVSCASVSLCVAVDAGGNVVSSIDPNAESPTWTVAYHVDTHQLYSVSCVLPSTCVAVDAAGNVVSSTIPTAGASAWTVTNVDGTHHQFNSVSCASVSLCVAVDSAGNGLVGNPAPPHTLSVSLTGSGSGVVTGSEISCPSSCSNSYPNGMSVSLTATPAAGSTFAGWSGACSGTGVCDLTLNSNEAVSATFTAKPSSGGSPTSSGNSGVGNPSPTAATNLTVAGAIVSLSDGVGMPLRCWAKSGSCVPATLELSVVEQLRGRQVIAVGARHTSKLRRRRVIVGSATITLSAGQSKTANIYLNPTSRQLLARYQRITALLQITSQQGQVLWRQAVGIFQPAKRTKKKHR